VLPERSAHRPLLRHLDVSSAAYVAKLARGPGEVAKAIANALDAPRPRFRTAVGPTAKFMHFARGKLPSRTVRKLFGRFFALQKVRW